ncbi:MAG: hypothetical protein HYU87_11255 [Chloroflexi bacterium]|nr:hypothetical protein [Chloroflexota bacterium]
MTIQLGLGLADPGAAAIWTRDDGTIDDPRTDVEWDAWVSARSVRHWCDADPLLDWLDRYGEQRGIVRDDRLPGYDARFDLQRLIGERGQRFEELVLEDLGRRHRMTHVGDLVDDVRSIDAARATWLSMVAGDPIVARAVLRDPQSRTYGVADLLVRSDVLLDLFPAAFDGEEERIVAPALPGQRWHYRLVDIRYTTLELLKDGSLSAANDLGLMARLWILNNALGRLQGATPPVTYVLGRGWRQGQLRGTTCFDRLGRVPQDAFVRSQERDVAVVAMEAIGWVRRVRSEGSEWRLRPVPSVPELYPNMKCRYDSPWQRAKRELAEALSELTLVNHVGPRIRAHAHARGVTRADDPRVSAGLLGVTAQNGARTVDAILAADRARDGQWIRPAKISADEGRWRSPAPVECYVDFETVNDVLDDLATFPERGGQQLIFQIGCGWCVDGQWRFRSFTARSLSPGAEAEMIDDWIDHLRSLAEPAGVGVAEVRLFHWSAAETSAIENAYRSAMVRHRERHWPPDLGWYDLLDRLINAEPVVVRGAHGFGLKAVANAMFAHGLISTQWADGLADGAGVMAGAWHAAKEAALRGVALSEIAHMREIDRYNEIDCRVMAQVLDHLRREH